MYFISFDTELSHNWPFQRMTGKLQKLKST